MNDRAIGYTVIIAVILLLVAPISYLILQTATPKTVRTITFRDVKGLSFLSVLDPVRMQGVEIGVVKKIDRNQTGALVTIETGCNVTLFEDYVIQVVSKGVMGDRYLTINPGTHSKQDVVPKTMLFGTISIGPDEALSYVTMLKTTVHRLNMLSKELAEGNSEKQSLVDQVHSITASIDTLVTSLYSTFLLLDTTLGKTVTRISGMIDNTTELLNEFDHSLPSGISNVNIAVATLDTVIIKTDSLLRELQPVLAAVNNPDLWLWKEYHAEIENSLLYLRKLLNEVANDSFTVPVRLW